MLQVLLELDQAAHTAISILERIIIADIKISKQY